MTHDRARLVEVGTRALAKLMTGPALEVIDLPDELGVCVLHTARGGAKCYVAPDESLLLVGSAFDFDTGLNDFRRGARTAHATSNER